MPLDHPRDARRQSCGKEDRLPLGRRLGQDCFQVIGETHVEHLVGFVKRQHREAAEIEGLAADVIERAARGGDDDIDAALEHALLLAEGVTTVDGDHRDFELLAIFVHRLGDLHRQLARRHQNKRGRLRPGIAEQRDPLQHWQRESGGLAGSGGSLPDDIAAREQSGDGFALNRCRLFVA